MSSASSPYTRMDPTEKAIWVAALRSGNYRQCSHQLHESRTNAFCCLGVELCVVRGLMPTEVNQGRDWILKTGLDHNAFDVLIKMNDGGKTFADIADWIEVNL